MQSDYLVNFPLVSDKFLVYFTTKLLRCTLFKCKYFSE